MSKTLTRLLLIVALPILLITPATVSARVISYQAVLYDSTGGTQQQIANMTFKIYDSSSGTAREGETLIWTEVHPNVSVAANGTFTVELGGGTPFPDNLFEGDVWLEVVVNGQTITPRTHLGSSPSTFTTDRITGDLRSYQGGFIAQDPADTNRWVDIGWRGIYIPLDTFYYPIPSAGGFVPYNNSAAYTISWFGGTMAATGLASTDSAAFYAEVHLPDSVKVIGLSAYIHDSDASRDLSFTFGYRGGLVATNIATLWTSGSNPALWTTISTTLNHKIENDCSRAYFVKVVARGSANEWGNVCLMCTRNRL